MKRNIMTALVLAPLFASSVFAADSAARRQLDERSKQAAVGVAQIPLLRVKAGAGRPAALNAVKARLSRTYDKIHFGGTAKTETGNKSIVQRGAGWMLEVAEDGHKVRYRNFEYLESASNKRIAVSQRPSQQQLETKGRSFIAEQLGDLVPLGPGEDLVPFFTEYQVSGGGATKPDAKPDPEMVGAANVVFTRTVDGVHVIGPGSKIAVMFGADGTVAGFDYDWPEYQKTPKSQKTISIADVQARAHKLAPADIERPDAKVERIECGILDRGTGRRDEAAPLQSACAIYTISRSIVDQAAYAKNPASGHIVTAKITVVPAGETVESDRKWDLAQRHLGQPYYGPEPPKDGPQRRTK